MKLILTLLAVLANALTVQAQKKSYTIGLVAKSQPASRPRKAETKAGPKAGPKAGQGVLF